MGLQKVLDEYYTSSSKRKAMEDRIKQAMDMLRAWDYKFEYHQIEASIFLAWEFNVMSFL